MTKVVKLDVFRRTRRLDCAPAPKEPHPADDLSFMKRRRPKGGGIDYWLINPTGNYSADCEAGRKLADEYLAYIGEHPTNGNTTLLTCIVHEMIDRAIAGQKWSGVHVGFLASVNRYAMATAGGLCGG
jgi:hypothetical protein